MRKSSFLIMAIIASLSLCHMPFTYAVTFDDAADNNIETGLNAAEDIVTVGVYIHGCDNLHNAPYLNMDGYKTAAEDASDGAGSTYYAQMFVARGIYNVEIEYSDDDKNRFHMKEPLTVDTTSFSASEINMLPDIYIEDGFSIEEQESEREVWLNEKVPKLGTLIFETNSEPIAAINIKLQNASTKETYEFTYMPSGHFVETLSEGEYQIIEIDSPKGSLYRPLKDVSNITIEQGKITTVTLENSYKKEIETTTANTGDIEKKVEEATQNHQGSYFLIIPVVIIYIVVMIGTIIFRRKKK